MLRLFFSTAVVTFLLVPRASHAQFEGMKYRVPADANTLILINAEKMFGSPVADRGRWEARRKAAYDAGISGLPPDGTEVLLAGRTDFEYGSSVWELGMLKLRGDRSVADVAQRYGGVMDQIAERDATRLPNDNYVVQLMSNLLAAYTPANRQDVKRWLSSTDVGGVSKLPSYLEQGFGYATKSGTPIVMALDVSGSVSAADVKTSLTSFQSLKDSGISAEPLTKLFAGIQGITLGITLQDQVVGAIRVDFAESPKILAEVGKPLLLEVLQKQGAMIEDLRQWQPSIEGNTFLLRGTFSESGTRRVLSVLELPRSLSDAMQQTASTNANPEDAQRLASQQYFQQITALLDDLRAKPKRSGVQTFGQAAIWYDKYARKIDGMSILNVDDDLVNYAASMAIALRQAEMIMKGVGMRSSVRTAGNQPVSGGYSWSVGGYRAGRGYNGGLYGAYGTTMGVGAGQASLRAKGQSDAIIRGQERTSGAANVQQVWQYIDESTAAIRRDLTRKYSADF